GRPPAVRPRALRRAPGVLRRVRQLPRADAADGSPERQGRRRHSERAGRAPARGVPRVAPVIAYKFLAPGSVGPFTGYRWEPGRWVEVHALDPCRRGIHACRVRDLPIWLDAELWEIELDGGIVEQDRKVVAGRG